VTAYDFCDNVLSLENPQIKKGYFHSPHSFSLEKPENKSTVEAALLAHVKRNTGGGALDRRADRQVAARRA
jgi:hypothetical protein